MKTLLVGDTGFVGSNIARQAKFSVRANSRNFHELVGQNFDLVVFAAAPAVKWWANANESEDHAIVADLINTLSSISAARFVLISTIDVYPDPICVNELTQIDAQANSAYGRHRYWLECEVRRQFPRHHVVRLPGLFGPGLKKNVLFDLLCRKLLDKINLDSSFQWYPLSRIWSDIEKTVTANLEVVNFAVEPIRTNLIHDRYFSDTRVAENPAEAVSYDMQTCFSQVFEAPCDRYLLDVEGMLAELDMWLENPRINRG